MVRPILPKVLEWMVNQAGSCDGPFLPGYGISVSLFPLRCPVFNIMKRIHSANLIYRLIARRIIITPSPRSDLNRRAEPIPEHAKKTIYELGKTADLFLSPNMQAIKARASENAPVASAIRYPEINASAFDRVVVPKI